MNHSRASRRIFAIASLFLAIAVSCWGTEYKLSLYSESAQPKTDVAKLLSEAERPAKPSTLAIKSRQTRLPEAAAFGAAIAIVPLTLSRPGWSTARIAAISALLPILIPTSGNSALRAPPVFAS